MQSQHFLLFVLSSMPPLKKCYVCDNQDGNTDKCLNTIKTCEQEDDRCLSIIRWSTTPYWSQVSRQKFKLHIYSRLDFRLHSQGLGF